MDNPEKLATLGTQDNKTTRHRTNKTKNTTPKTKNDKQPQLPPPPPKKPGVKPYVSVNDKQFLLSNLEVSSFCIFK
jgi:hypothetical protein